ncbi:MAG: hypothetical protein FWC43_14485 [Planctomycetaceae bacterium]|nr:hypothetical protein [Planctomycetaceae bacterium]
MAQAVECPYYRNGYCNISGCSQSQYQRENYCLTEQGKGNDWKSCANYQGASERDRIEKR